MNLAVFDLDGTLIGLNPIDDEAFATAFREELGIDCSTTDWSQFEYVTNTGIAAALLETIEEAKRAEALARVRSRFIDLLARGSSEDGRGFVPIRGAAEVVARLPHAQWNAVIATGCWRASVEVKLRSSGLGPILPFVCSDDDRSREGIVRRAIELARGNYGCDFDRVVMIGDAVWDVRTASNLGLPFVGVATPERELALRSAGATHFIRDFSDFDAVLHALEEATAPVKFAR